MQVVHIPEVLVETFTIDGKHCFASTSVSAAAREAAAFVTAVPNALFHCLLCEGRNDFGQIVYSVTIYGKDERDCACIVETTHVYPPIPFRTHDWSATFRGYDLDDRIGWGRTEVEAINNLLAQ